MQGKAAQESHRPGHVSPDRQVLRTVFVLARDVVAPHQIFGGLTADNRGCFQLLPCSDGCQFLRSGRYFIQKWRVGMMVIFIYKKNLVFFKEAKGAKVLCQHFSDA